MQSAVSQVFNSQDSQNYEAGREVTAQYRVRHADCESAIRRIGNLRYGVTACLLFFAMLGTACDRNHPTLAEAPQQQSTAATNLPVQTSTDMATLPAFPTDQSELHKALEQGRIQFDELACWRCHTLGDEELPGNPDFENSGPDLLDVGSRLEPEAILQSILDPNAVIAEPVADYTTENGSSRMPEFKEGLTADTLQSLVIYLSNNRLELEQQDLTVTVSEASFEKEVTQATSLVLLDFWAEWCLPCLEINPILEDLSNEYDGRVKICKIDVDENPDLVAEYVPDNIFPCLILMKDGQLLERRYGADPNMEIEPFFRKWFEDNLTPDP